MTRRRQLLGALAATVAAAALGGPAFAQVGPSPLPPPPPELEPVTDLLPPLGDFACGTADGTLPTAAVELLGPWIVLICPVPPSTPPPAEEPVDEGGEATILPPPPATVVGDEVLPTLAPPVAIPGSTIVRRTPRTVPPRRTVELPSTLAAAPSGFAYRVMFLFPLALLALGGYVGWLLNRPVTPSRA